MSMEMLELGRCPKCHSYDCTCCHETVNGPELWVWSECVECGHQFIEIFKLDRVDTWKEHR